MVHYVGINDSTLNYMFREYDKRLISSTELPPTTAYYLVRYLKHNEGDGTTTIGPSIVSSTPRRAYGRPESSTDQNDQQIRDSAAKWPREADAKNDFIESVRRVLSGLLTRTTDYNIRLVINSIESGGTPDYATYDDEGNAATYSIKNVRQDVTVEISDILPTLVDTALNGMMLCRYLPNPPVALTLDAYLVGVVPGDEQLSYFTSIVNREYDGYDDFPPDRKVIAGLKYYAVTITAGAKGTTLQSIPLDKITTELTSLISSAYLDIASAGVEQNFLHPSNVSVLTNSESGDIAQVRLSNFTRAKQIPSGDRIYCLLATRAALGVMCYDLTQRDDVSTNKGEEARLKGIIETEQQKLFDESAKIKRERKVAEPNIN
jgi:hypothetical protein